MSTCLACMIKTLLLLRSRENQAHSGPPQRTAKDELGSRVLAEQGFDDGKGHGKDSWCIEDDQLQGIMFRK